MLGCENFIRTDTFSQSDTFESLLPKCRICLDTRGCIDIFEAPRLAECIQLCTNVIINIKDNFPRKVCRSCNRLIQAAMTLRSLTRSAEFRLRSLKPTQCVNSEVTLECTPDIHIDPEAEHVNVENSTKNENPILEKEKLFINSNKQEKVIQMSANLPKTEAIKDVLNQRTILQTKTKNNLSISEDNSQNQYPSTCWMIKNNIKENTTTRVYSFQCKICNKCFKSRNSLYFHKRYHDVYKKHSCNLCEKKFTTKSDLTKHTRVHTGEKPFKCNQCCKTFSQNCSLKAHLKLHTKNNEDFSTNLS